MAGPCVEYRLFPFDRSRSCAGSTGCLQLLEILEISWNSIGPPGNFCV